MISVHLQCSQKVFRPPLQFCQFCYAAARLYSRWNSSLSPNHTQHPITTKWKQNFRNVWNLLFFKLKYHIGMRIQTFGNNTWNLAPVPPISLDGCWHVPIAWAGLRESWLEQSTGISSMKTCSTALRTSDWAEGLFSNMITILRTQPRQHRNGLGTTLWMS